VGNPETPLPPGWHWTLLSEVARLESGHTPSRHHPEYWDGPIRWMGIRDAREHHGGIISDTEQHVSQAGIDNSAARVLPPGTVCLSRTASVGYVVITTTEMATSQDFVNWVCSTALEPRFLQLALLAEGRDGLASFGEGSVHTTIYFPAVKAFHIALPPVSEQRRIVARLDTLLTEVRAAREQLDQVPRLVERLRRSVLAAAFRGDLTASWRAAHPEAEPASVLLERIRAERRRRWEEANPRKRYVEPEGIDAAAEGLPELPDGWCWAALDEIIEGFDAGRSPRTEGRPAIADEHGVLKVSAVTWGTFDPRENKALLPGDTPEPGTTVREGDLLISRANTYDLVGAVVLVEEDHPRLMLSDKTLRVRYLPGVEPSYLLHALRSPCVRASFELDASGTSDSMRNLSQVKMGRAPIALAPLAEQAQVAAMVVAAADAVRDLTVAHAAARRDVEAGERALLSKAFRGELVPQDPSDEPADVMLARLRDAREPAPAKRPRRGST
jgi:restriction endonuclease S subunit